MLQYLLEIGCEELPAAFIPRCADFIKTETATRLEQTGLSYEKIISGGTPRRLYLCIEGLAEKQDDKSEIIMGPPAAVAFDEKGGITPVGKKFAESKGLDISSLKKVITLKGEYLQGERKTGGQDAAPILKNIIPEIIKSIPFAKSMKWGSGDFKFARPVHSFLSVLGGNVLPFEIGGIEASNITYGHRFLAPAGIMVSSFEEYKEGLEKAFVIIDEADRKKIITDSLASFAKGKSLQIDPEEDLLDTVANLVEYPHGIMGSFDKEFLELPEEVLVTSMKINQKYFPARDKSGKLSPFFVGIANIVPPEGDSLIRQGYERVLRARLNDAAFFFANDKKIPLEEREETLKNVVYQEKLGSVYDKVLRMEKIAGFLSEKFAPEKTGDVKTSARLAKADLMSEMVYEFPELQGIMGYYYAKLQGKSENICMGIKEHYLPKSAGDALPETDEGAFVSIADKLDSICSAFAAGMIPTGNLDPYGLRRNAIGILAVIEDRNLNLDMNEAVELALNSLSGTLEFDKNETKLKILAFITQRLRQIMISRGDCDGEIFDAVSGKSFDPAALYNLAKVIYGARQSENFLIIAESFKRINNILKKSGWTSSDYSRELFEAEEEKAIAALIENQNIAYLMENEKNYEALDQLMKFAPAVNAFFSKVMVMSEDEKVRNNRLGLLKSLRDVFLNVGNFDGISSK